MKNTFLWNEHFSQTVIKGLTGEIKFDNQGYRTVFTVEIVGLTPAGIEKIGTWDSSEGLSITLADEKAGAIESGSLRNKTFIVLTALVLNVVTW